MKMLENRLDPTALSAYDLRTLDRLTDIVLADERPGLVGREGVRIDLPKPILRLLVDVLRNLRAGKALVVLPETETLTTQAAAEFLGVSRPSVVDLLDKGQIPHHLVGTHRRVYIKDLIEYQGRRDISRRKTLDALRQEVEAAGLYESSRAPSPSHAR